VAIFVVIAVAATAAVIHGVTVM